MKIAGLAAALLSAGVGAAPLEARTFLETDALAAEGVFNLGLYVAKNGYPSAKTCTLENVALRREWYVCNSDIPSQLLTGPGQRYRRPKRRPTYQLCNAWLASHRKLPLASRQAQGADTMTLLPRISTPQ